MTSTKQRATPAIPRVTIRTVASDAGVSVAAVSKVLRAAYGVSPEMREKVNASIAKLGYRPSGPARGLRGRTFMIGVLLVEVRNSFLPDVIDAVNLALEASNYRAMIGVGRARESLESSLIESMIDYKMDGLILVAPGLSPDVVERYAAEIPIVTVGYHHPAARSFDTVNTDDRAGARLAVETLVAAGHLDVAMFSQAPYLGHKVSVVLEREIGYREAMEAAGLGAAVRIADIPLRSPEREREIARLIADPDLGSAVFCWSDLDAVAVLAAAEAAGRKVPDEFALVGFDNSGVAGVPMVGLSSIDQDASALGELATRTLLSRIGGRREAVHRLTRPSFVPRRSSKAATP